MVDELRHPNVVHVEEVKASARERGRFGYKRRKLGGATGARGIGCSWFELAPGQTAFPAHYHCRNEESVYILEGTGSLRIKDETVEVGPGDYATFPVGPEACHQLTATGEEPLRYLCLSTLGTPEVVGYPDSNKVGAIAVRPEGGADDVWFAKWFPVDADVDYFEGEDA